MAQIILTFTFILRSLLGDENFEKQAVMKANQKLNPKLFVKKDTYVRLFEINKHFAKMSDCGSNF